MSLEKSGADALLLPDLSLEKPYLAVMVQWILRQWHLRLLSFLLRNPPHLSLSHFFLCFTLPNYCWLNKGQDSFSVIKCFCYKLTARQLWLCVKTNSHGIEVTWISCFFKEKTQNDQLSTLVALQWTFLLITEVSPYSLSN